MVVRKQFVVCMRDLRSLTSATAIRSSSCIVLYRIHVYISLEIIFLVILYALHRYTCKQKVHIIVQFKKIKVICFSRFLCKLLIRKIIFKMLSSLKIKKYLFFIKSSPYIFLSFQILKTFCSKDYG